MTIADRQPGGGSRISVSIVGFSEYTNEPDDTKNLEELVFHSAREALAASGLGRDEIDGIVLAASDQTDGRAISSMLTAGPAGAYLNDEINIASSPGHGFAMACLAILSGVHRRVLFSTWGKASENVTNGGHAAVERLAADPYFERDGGSSSLAALAFQALRNRSRAVGVEEAVRAIVVKNSLNASLNAEGLAREPISEEDILSSPLIAHPLRELEMAPVCDGVYTVVLAASELADPKSAVAVQGLGWCSDTARVSERDLVGLPHLATAATAAYRQASIEDPRTELDFCELHDYIADAEMLAYEPLRLCAVGEGVEVAVSARHARGGAQPVNVSGGSIAGEAPFGGGTRKVVNAIRQIRGDAGAAQVDRAERGLVQIASGYAGQFQTVIILGKDAR